LEIYNTHSNDGYITILIGSALEIIRDINNLNAAPPENPLFSNIINQLSELALKNKEQKKEALAVETLSSVARIMARQYDELAERSYARLVTLLPDASWAHYNQGLFFKTRGRFKEGVSANQRAIALNKGDSEGYQWNLGICATGSGKADIALKIWQDMGNKIKMGRFDLPEGGYPSCKIKLAERPLAERDASNDTPGLEETIWIERLSPCHGVIRSVLYQDLGINYGDVVLFDGAPITYHKYGEEQIAVFPHLSTLQKNNYQIYHFAGTQAQNGNLNHISQQLEEDAIIYSHTENYRTLCSGCWKDEAIDHEHIENEEKHVVTGCIAAPKSMSPQEILEQIDFALKDTPENRIFSPELCFAAGLKDRSKIEERRYNLLCKK
ncbi:MAG: prenyltransferase, partial [Gammaproteobacteria bacterium]|nr:prenyltransferase [Gammaproteobacteria bacterium]